MGPVPGTMLPCRTDDQVVRIVAVNGTHRLPDALAPLINVRSGARGVLVKRSETFRNGCGSETIRNVLFWIIIGPLRNVSFAAASDDCLGRFGTFQNVLGHQHFISAQWRLLDGSVRVSIARLH